MKAIVTAVLCLTVLSTSAQSGSTFFKGANTIELNAYNVEDPLKAAGQFLVEKGYSIDKFDDAFGQLVSSSKECPTHSSWQCRYVITLVRNTLYWKTEGKSSVSFSAAAQPQWVTAAYKIGFMDILKATEQTVLEFKRKTGAGDVIYSVK